LLLAGSEVVDRDPVLRAVLRDLARRYAAWRSVGGDPVASGVHDDYRTGSATIGREVTVHLPGGATRTGRAVDVDEQGRLVVAADDGVDTLAAGDVVHLR
jgi:BirA family biotin operon repressor/biotin-[acetyl-CoA-carboxylase] ligase